MRNSLNQKQQEEQLIEHSLRWYIMESLAQCPKYAASMVEIRQRFEKELVQRLADHQLNHIHA